MFRVLFEVTTKTVFANGLHHSIQGIELNFILNLN